MGNCKWSKTRAWTLEVCLLLCSVCLQASTLVATPCVNAYSLDKRYRAQVFTPAFVASGNLFEENEKLVNQIYLETIAQEVYELNNEQESVIYGIANQCPLAGGRAVYQARSMWALLYENVVYDDDALCEAVNLNWRVAQPHIKTTKLSVYPNPTNGNLNFLFTDKLLTDTELRIYDAVGKQVQTVSLSSALNRYVLDTSPLPQGVYFYKVNGIEGKFVVIK